MTKASLTTNNKNNVDLVLLPEKSSPPINEASIYKLIEESAHKHLLVNIDNIKNAIAEFNNQLKVVSNGAHPIEIRYEILQRIDATITFSIDPDEMSASAEITTAQGGKHLGAKSILTAAQEAGITKGFIKSALIGLAQDAAHAVPNTLITAIIAKGKNPINGRDTQIKMLVESAQSRILQPRELEDGSVDMRDLGDIICVKIGDPLAQRIPFTQGTEGYTVKGNPLEAKPGEDCKLIAGEGTALSPHNEDLLISELVGLPKLIDNGMTVDKVYQIKNVDISTGHVKFEGSVLISGDVKESMIVEASGDISVGGFVESATLKAGGDITIAKGIIGHKQDIEENHNIHDLQMSAVIHSAGNIFATYSQYAEINCSGNIRIENQVMHNVVHVDGKLWVGTQEKANGKLIGGHISAGISISAGIIGAAAGSKTIVSFDKPIQILKDKLTEIEERYLIESQKCDELRDLIKKLKALPKDKAKPEMLDKVVSTYQFHSNEMAKTLSEKELADKELQAYMTKVYVEATERLYHGVQLQVGDFNDRSKREYGPSKMFYLERKIHIEAIVHT